MAKTINLNCFICRKVFNVKENRKETAKYCSYECKYSYKPKAILKNCRHCQKIFKTYHSTTAKKESNYCSYKCALNRKSTISKNCLFCKKKFDFYGSRTRKAERKYCSHLCSSQDIKPIDRVYFFKKAQEKFFKRIKYENDCWLWTGAKTNYGYGVFGIGGENKRTHRFSWEFHNGGIPEGNIVCHKCDNPSCVNPDHLFLGNHKDNTQDMVNKKRNIKAVGQNHPLSKLKENDVLEIRNKLKSGEKLKKIANDFNVTISNIRKIKNNNSWKHVQ